LASAKEGAALLWGREEKRKKTVPAPGRGGFTPKEDANKRTQEKGKNSKEIKINLEGEKCTL